MTRLCCPPCRLRFTPTAAALGACPGCGKPLRASSLQDTVGFRLYEPEDIPDSLPDAVAVTLPIPDPDRGQP